MTLWIAPVEGIGEVTAGDDLAALLASYAWQDGDIVIVTSKVVSKAEGRVVGLPRTEAVAHETDREVARRGQTRIVRNRLGLTMAAAGVDASNTPPGTAVLLPLDPDESARRLREGLLRLGANVAVVVSDTSGRAWRLGQTDVAVGAAGLAVLHDLAGQEDRYGNALSVTAPAVADELAGAADLVKGKLHGYPAAVVRGLEDWVLPAGQHGPGAQALVREEAQDMFGLGAREAVVAAVVGGDPRGFGAPAAAAELYAALLALDSGLVVTGGRELVVRLPQVGPRAAGRLAAQLAALARGHAWEVAEESAETLRLRPRTP